MKYCQHCKKPQPEATTSACPTCGFPLEDRSDAASENLYAPGESTPTLPPSTGGELPELPASLPPQRAGRAPLPPQPAPTPVSLPVQRSALVSPPEDEPAAAPSQPSPAALAPPSLDPVEPPAPPPPPPAEESAFDLEEDIQLRTGASRSHREASRDDSAEAEWESPDAREAYKRVVDRVAEHIKNDYDLFGFVGHTNSGKTHCHKALDRLLRNHGVVSEKAQTRLDKAHVPGNTDAEVFDFVYTGDKEKWVIIDAGGELYASLQDNDWSQLEARQAELTHWLHHCKGLFMFLHLNRAHFDPRLMSQEAVLADDPDGSNERVEKRVRKARAAQRELYFFQNFLLFLRVLKARNGKVAEVVAQCRDHETLEEGLRDQAQNLPRLDIPVMFFFTKADSYTRGFEIANGTHFAPFRMPMDPMVFTARYLPVLFNGLLQHVRRFKFDFLQSHLEFPQTRGGEPVFEDGKPKMSVRWNADPQTPLSVGLLPGLEFVLRNKPSAGGLRGLWNGPGIDTRTAMLLHRMSHREAWKDVKVDLGTWGDAWKGLR